MRERGGSDAPKFDRRGGGVLRDEGGEGGAAGAAGDGAHVSRVWVCLLLEGGGVGGDGGGDGGEVRGGEDAAGG